jgi:predicted MFS family arabinose efflux permease
VVIRWSDYIGRKRVLLGIMIVLCIGTVLCIVGSSLPVVLLGRILQGGCNVTFGLAFLILRERLSGQAFGFCCGVIASINGGVGGVDALVGGFMVDRFGYRSIFVLILVLGVAAIVFGAKAVPADDPGRAASGRMDWVGAALIALAVAGIDLFLTEGGHAGWSSPVALGFIAAAIVALVAFVVVEKRVAKPLIDIDEMRSRYAWPLIVVTILCLASFTMVIGYIMPSIAEDDDGFGASAQMTALLFLTPAALVQLISSPLIGRLAVRVGFVTVLRAGLIGAVPITALVAIFALEKNVVILLIAVLGFAYAGVAGTALSVLGSCRHDKTSQGRCPASVTPPSVSGRHSDSLGPDRLSGRARRRGFTRRCGSASRSASSPLVRAWFSSRGRPSNFGRQAYWRTGQPEMASSSCAGPVPLVGSVFHGQSLERNGARLGSTAF